MNNKEIEKFLAFVNTASDAIGDEYDTIRFTCPLCGGDAYVGRATYNGHMHASCSTCEITVAE